MVGHNISLRQMVKNISLVHKPKIFSFLFLK